MNQESSQSTVVAVREYGDSRRQRPGNDFLASQLDHKKVTDTREMRSVGTVNFLISSGKNGHPGPQYSPAVRIDVTVRENKK